MKRSPRHVTVPLCIVASAATLLLLACSGPTGQPSSHRSASYQMGYNAAVDWVNHGDPSLTQSHYGGMGMCKVMLDTAHTRAASLGEPKPSSGSDYLAGCQDALKKAGW